MLEALTENFNDYYYNKNNDDDRNEGERHECIKSNYSFNYKYNENDDNDDENRNEGERHECTKSNFLMLSLIPPPHYAHQQSTL